MSRWNYLAVPEHVQYILKYKTHFDSAILYEVIRKKSLNASFLHYTLFINSILSASEWFESTVTNNLVVVIVQ